MIRVRADSDDLYKSIDLAIRKLNVKLHKWKDKIKDHHKIEGQAKKMPIEVYERQESEEELINDEIEEQNFNECVKEFTMPKITKTKAGQLRVLKTDEAIMRMELAGDHFLIYKCEEDQQLKVMYKRRDGSVGVLQPEGGS